eukprot:2887908-Rhodomonas_salina.2
MGERADWDVALGSEESRSLEERLHLLRTSSRSYAPPHHPREHASRVLLALRGCFLVPLSRSVPPYAPATRCPVVT